MSREAHVQFCESLGVRFPGATHRNIYVGSERAGHNSFALALALPNAYFTKLGLPPLVCAGLA